MYFYRHNILFIKDIDGQYLYKCINQLLVDNRNLEAIYKTRTNILKKTYKIILRTFCCGLSVHPKSSDDTVLLAGRQAVPNLE